MLRRLHGSNGVSAQLRGWLRSSHCPNESRHLATNSQTIEVLGRQYPIDDTCNITPSIISKLQERLYTKPGHPIHILKSLIESHFQHRGTATGTSSSSATHFATPSGSSLSPLVTPKQNFDDLSFPADHPGRSLQDSYYLNRDLLLRTHTSAHEVELFARGDKRWLLTADVYRRDEIDASHYPVFHQMEGASLFSTDPSELRELQESIDDARFSAEQRELDIEDLTEIGKDNPYQANHDPAQVNLVVQSLKYSINGLMLKLFRDAAGVSKGSPLRVRWIPAYFPFTSPSYEVEVFFNGKWLEILGCGVVQQATLQHAKVENKIGWAFGLGLERIAMILCSIPDIRLFWSKDDRFLSQFSSGNLRKFQPYSKYPACYKDLSFWLPSPSLEHNDFFDLVRDISGDLVENVELIDDFVHPKNQRRSLCFRINYRSMDRSLSNDEVNELHTRVASQSKDQFGVEIR